MTRLLCILGPTASGKSDLALRLARELGGELVNADSRQFYRELDIGTAKPTPSERERVPHHLIDTAGIESPWSVAEFVHAAENAIADIAARGKLPILVGGTGMYLRSLLYGLATIPPISDDIRQTLEEELSGKGLPALFAELQSCDPQGAGRLKAGDTHRILRALEVFRQTGRPIHEFWPDEKGAMRYDALLLGMDWERPELYRRIDERVIAMLTRGLKAEAQNLWERFPENGLLAKTIGYAEWRDPALTHDAAVLATIQLNSRHFAKRQLTWFRRESGVQWVHPVRDEGKLLQHIKTFSRQALSLR